MIELLDTILEKLPLLKGNVKTLLFLSLTGLFVGFTGFPLWLVYRNEEEILEFVLNLNGKPISEKFTKAQMVEINSTLKSLVETTNANRAIFGIYQNNNRIILSEFYRPYDAPLPIGFQTVYLATPDYETLLNSIRVNQCFRVDKPETLNYFTVEFILSNSVTYLSCPSGGNWFLALYLTEENTGAQIRLEQETDKLKGILN
jgi:hypothetical protein